MRTRARTAVPGESGIWIVVLGDLALFVVLFGLFLYYRDRQPAVFAASQAQLHTQFGLADTLLLVTSSLAVAAGVREHRTGRPDGARWALLVAVALGGLFVVSKVTEWTTEATAGHVPLSNDFFSLYFVLTGLHLLHVLLGLGALAIARAIARHATPGPHDAALICSCAVFWHLVDLLWLFLFALLYFVH